MSQVGRAEGNADWTGSEPQLYELGAASFTASIPSLLGIYRAAMRPPDDQLVGRTKIMERHAVVPGFRAVTATAFAAPIGFAYGFPGRQGQWWFDIVTEALRNQEPSVRAWLWDTFEVAEFHVHPHWQGQGVGRRLLEQLAAARSERTAALSTYSGESRARQLYRAYGFVDLLADFHFPGNPTQAFAIMAAPLPLPELPRYPAADTPPA